MAAERMPYFLKVSREWWGMAQALRDSGVPEHDPVLTVWREAAWCHLLLSRGREDLVPKWLRAVAEKLTGEPVGRDQAPADLFGRMWAAVLSRHRSAA